MALDSRLHAFRADLADERLETLFAAPRYVRGMPACVRVGRARVLRAPEDDAAIETFYHYGERISVFERGESFSWGQSDFDGDVGDLRTDQLGEIPDRNRA